MKISILTAFYPFRGGIAHFNESLVRELDKVHEVQVNTFQTQYPSFLFPGKSQFVEMKNPEWEGRAHRIVSPFNPFSFFRGSVLIAKQQPDLFLANYWMTPFALMTAFLARRLKKKSTRILLVHNLVPHEKRFFDRWMNALILNQFDGFVALSENVKEDIVRCKMNAKVCVIEHPWYNHFNEPISKDQACEKLGIDPHSKVLLFFGLIRDYKGLDVLLEAFSGLDSSFQLLIAGEFYSDISEFKKWFEDPVLKKRIHIYNRFIPDEEVHLFFSASDLCVLPYRHGTQSGVTATAFHFGVPVLVTAVGGLPETVGEKGLIVPAENPRALCDTINEAFLNDTLSAMKCAIDADCKNYSWSSFTKKLLNFSQGLGTTG